MKIVLLTSDSPRHKYIAASLAKELELCLVVNEKKSPKIEETSEYGKKDAEFLNLHFKSRTLSERSFFGRFDNFRKEVRNLEIPHGFINSKFVTQEILKANPDFLVLFGTSILKNPLLKTFEKRVINLHLGLSPYYRGSATNLYPFLFDEPECVGATLHLATEEVDKGGILHQFRPVMKEEDTVHDIGNKVIQKAGVFLPEVLKAFSQGTIHPKDQIGTGRLCRNKDITPYVLRQIYKNFEDGMIPKYLEEKKIRDSKKPIVTQNLNGD